MAMKAPQHVWKTADGRLVPDGDPDAAFLEYAAGDDMTVVPDWLAEEKPTADEPDGDEVDAKAAPKPADKARKPAANK